MTNHFFNTSYESDNFIVESQYLIKFDDDYEDEKINGNSMSSDCGNSDNNGNNGINSTPMRMSNSEPRKILPIDSLKKLKSSRPSPEEISPRLMFHGTC